jgi:cob(I)alamin adenosyltransferase
MRISGNKTILLALGALVALAIAGCGGGGGDETETSTPTVEEPVALTKDELITQGDGICAEVNAAVGALSGSETPESTAGDSTEKVANLYIGMIERLQDLGAPEGEETDYAKFMEAGEELAKVEGEAKLAAEREDVAAMEEKGQEAAAALESFQSQAAIYGFEDCSAEPGLPPAVDGGPATEGGEEFEGEEEGGVEPEYVEPPAEEEIYPPGEEVAPETGGAGGSPEAPEPAPETGGESGGVGPG